MRFTEKRTTTIIRSATLEVQGSEILMVVKHSTERPHQVKWVASGGGYLLGNRASGSIAAMSDDPTAALDEGQTRAAEAGELLAKLAALGGSHVE